MFKKVLAAMTAFVAMVVMALPAAAWWGPFGVFGPFGAFGPFGVFGPFGFGCGFGGFGLGFGGCW